MHADTCADDQTLSCEEQWILKTRQASTLGRHGTDGAGFKAVMRFLGSPVALLFRIVRFGNFRVFLMAMSGVCQSTCKIPDHTIPLLGQPVSHHLCNFLNESLLRSA